MREVSFLDALFTLFLVFVAAPVVVFALALLVVEYGSMVAEAWSFHPLVGVWAAIAIPIFEITFVVACFRAGASS